MPAIAWRKDGFPWIHFIQHNINNITTRQKPKYRPAGLEIVSMGVQRHPDRNNQKDRYQAIKNKWVWSADAFRKEPDNLNQSSGKATGKNANNTAATA